MKRIAWIAALLSLAILSAAIADDGIKTRGVAEKAADVEKRVEKLTTEITWHSSLEEAKDQAKAEGKLIFYMHILGELDGVT